MTDDRTDRHAGDAQEQHLSDAPEPQPSPEPQPQANGHDRKAEIVAELAALDQVDAGKILKARATELGVTATDLKNTVAEKRKAIRDAKKRADDEPKARPTGDALQAEIDRIAALDSVTYDRTEKTEAEELGITVRTLKKLVAVARLKAEARAQSEAEAAEEARNRANFERTNTNEGVPQEFLDRLARGEPPPRETDEPPPEAGPQPDPDPKRKGKPPENLLAMLAMIETRTVWRGAVRWNAFTESMEVRQPWPPSGINAGFRPLQETFDVIECALWLQANGFPKATKNQAFDVMLRLAVKNAYHPIRDYFTNLPPWDGTARIDKLFVNYFGAELPDDPTDPENDNERDRRWVYHEHVSRCFMVSAVARIHQPGCKVDHMPVLVGPERYGKSRGLAALCPDPTWFSDDVPTDIGSKDAKEALVSKWIVELAEMPHQRREVEKVKAFLSRTADRYRVPYEKLAIDQPRTCVFIGSANELELISVTGNRRFWPVEVTSPVKVDAIVADRDQLWAEALHAYRAGDQWWLKPHIEDIAGERQQAHEEHDPWQDDLAKWIAERTDKNVQPNIVPPFTLLEAMAGAGLLFGMLDLKAVDPRNISRAKQCLKRLRWRSKEFRLNRVRGRYWVPRDFQ